MNDCEYKEICRLPLEFCPDDSLDCSTYEYFCESLDESDRKMEVEVYE